MKRLVFGLISACTIVASIAACSSSSSNDSPQSVCSSFANALIANEQKCEGSIDPSQVSASAARYSELCEAQIALPGVASNYRSLLSACASAVQAADCNTSIEQLTACNISVTGTLANAAPCSAAIECQSGSCSAGSLSQSADGGSSSCGTCQPALADGASCESGGVCVTGDTCVFTTSSDGTFSAICTKKTAPGGAGATCTTSGDCAPPYHCAPPVGSSETGVCAAAATAGTACDVTSDCTSGLVCAVNFTNGGAGGGPNNTCVVALTSGATCTEGQCAIGLACDMTSNTCKPFTFGAPGAECDGVTKLCSNGGCNVENVSDAGASAQDTCPTIIADGQPCDVTSGSAVCDEFASCTNGTCTLTPATCN